MSSDPATPVPSRLSPRRWLPLCVLLAFANPNPARSTDLQYFRNDHGRAPAGARPLPHRLDQSESLRWRVPLDSGHSTPVIRNGRIFLTTYRALASELATVALAAEDGRFLWRQIAPAARIEEFHRQTGNAAQATPACDGERVYVFFGSCGLLCYDLEGRPVWEHRLGPFQDEYGSGSSPVLVENKVILQQDHDVDSFLMAFEASTGRVIWHQARPNAVRSYSTPAIWSRNGRRELLVAGALELAAYDPDNGQRLWWTGGLARIVIPVPLPAGDLVFMASWAPGGDASRRIGLDDWATAIGRWDKNGDDKLAEAEVDNADVLDRFFRMDLDRSGDLSRAEWERHAAVFRRARNALLAIKPSVERGELPSRDLIWEHTRGVPYVASPLLDAGVVWMVKDGGIVTKLEAATGRLIEEERLPGGGGYYASPVAGDGKVYFASEQGVVSVVTNTAGWQVLSSHAFRERIHATPVAHATSLYVRTEQALYRFDSARPAD